MAPQCEIRFVFKTKRIFHRRIKVEIENRIIDPRGRSHNLIEIRSIRILINDPFSIERNRSVEITQRIKRELRIISCLETQAWFANDKNTILIDSSF